MADESDLDFNFTRYERNETCGRIEIDFIVRFPGSIPSREQILDNLSLFYSFDKSLGVLDRLKSRAGKKEVRGSVRIYDSDLDRKRWESITGKRHH